MHIWTTLKIFVSSTFKDLELERDQLAQVFTNIQQKIFERRLHLIPYDLRWREHSEENLVKWCLNMVQQCGYFIGVLGYRYGWRPPYDYYDAENVKNISITEMEIEMAKSVIAKKKRIFFVGDLSQYSEQELSSESVEDKNSLEDLKNRLSAEQETIFSYNTTRELLTLLEDVLQKIIDEEYVPGIKAKFEEYSRGDALHEIIEEKRRGFVGQKQHLDFFHHFANDTEKKNYLVVEAVAGTGKSALLAEFIYVWRQQNKAPIIAHYMSMSGDSRSSEGVMQSLGEQLVTIGWLEELELSPQEQTEQIHNALKNKKEHLVIAIDGVDEMDEEGQALSWLPQSLPDNVRIVITTRPTEVWQKLKEFPLVHHYNLPVLEEENIREIIGQYRNKVKISAEEENFLVKRASGSPLFLKVSLDEMAAGGIAVGQLAETVDALFYQILKRLQTKYGEKIVSDYLGLIAASRSGLMEAELREILYADFRSMIADDFFCSLQKSLANFVIQREKLLAFFHPEFERSVKMWLGKMHLRTSHVRLSNYFTAKGYDYERSLSEIAYQTQWGEEYKKLLQLFSDLPFLEKKCCARMLVDLRKDLNFAIHNITVPLPNTLQLPVNEGYLDKESLKIIAKIIDLNFHFLLRHPQCLLQCLWNYGYWYDAPSAQEHYVEEHISTSCFYKIANYWRMQKEQQKNWVWLETLRPLPEPLDSATEKIFRGHEQMVSCVRLNNNEDKIISCSVDQTIRIWDIDSGECLQTLSGHTNYISGICFIDKESKIASSSGDNSIKIWDSKTGLCIRTITGHENHVSAIGSDVNGQYLVSGSKDKTVRLWDFNTGVCIRIFEGHTKTINSVFVNKEGTEIVSGAWDNTTRIWDLTTGECIRVLEGHEDDVKSVCMNMDGTKIFSASKDFTARIWDATTGECLHILKHKSAVFNLACSQDGSVLTTAAFGTIRTWDTETGECLFKSDGHESAIFAIAMSKSGKKIISGSGDRTIRLWNTSKEADRIPEGHRDTMQNISLAKSDFAATSSKDGDVRIWNIKNGKCISTIETKEYIRFAHFCLDDQYILTGGENKELSLWDIKTGNKFTSFPGHEKLILCGTTSQNGQYIVSGGRDRLTIVWDFEGNIIQQFHGHTQAVRSVTINNNNTLVASGGEDYVIKIWDMQNGECVSTLEGHTSGVTSILFLNDKELISSGRDNTIKVWCLENKICTATYSGTANVEQFANENSYYVLAEQVETKLCMKNNQQDITFFPSILRHAVMNSKNYICAYGGQYTYLLKINGL